MTSGAAGVGEGAPDAHDVTRYVSHHDGTRTRSSSRKDRRPYNPRRLPNKGLERVVIQRSLAPRRRTNCAFEAFCCQKGAGLGDTSTYQSAEALSCGRNSDSFLLHLLIKSSAKRGWQRASWVPSII